MGVKLADETLCAPWLIDATGRRARIARRLGFKREILDQMTPFIAHPPQQGADQDRRRFLEALPHGLYYSVLIPGRRRIFSFQTDADLLPGGGETIPGMRSVSRKPLCSRRSLTVMATFSRCFATDFGSLRQTGTLSWRRPAGRGRCRHVLQSIIGLGNPQSDKVWAASRRSRDTEHRDKPPSIRGRS